MLKKRAGEYTLRISKINSLKFLLLLRVYPHKYCYIYIYILWRVYQLLGNDLVNICPL
jgi:hypothetical protein